ASGAGAGIAESRLGGRALLSGLGADCDRPRRAAGRECAACRRRADPSGFVPAHGGCPAQARHRRPQRGAVGIGKGGRRRHLLQRDLRRLTRWGPVHRLAWRECLRWPGEALTLWVRQPRGMRWRYSTSSSVSRPRRRRPSAAETSACVHRSVRGKMLAQDSYEVVVAPDGESAVTLAREQLPDLIFLDIVLPGISGFAVLRALRRDSRTRTTPIVMMSGNQQATEQFYVQRFGADGFVKKPFGRADVFHAIRALVQAGRMPARLEAEPVDAIPEGMTQEEWNAIPDVGMPDEAHMAPGPAAESATAEP